MHTLRRIFISTIMAMALLCLPLMTVSQPAYALFENAKTSACDGVKLAEAGACDTAGSDNSINSVLSAALNIFSLVIGILAVFMVLFGGFKFIVARGESNEVSSARNTILYALIGLAVAALAQFLVRFVLARVG